MKKEEAKALIENLFRKKVRKDCKIHNAYLLVHSEKMGIHMNVRGPRVISEALGAVIDEDFGIISAERPNSHYCFRARKV